jgi:hypothetical protein
MKACVADTNNDRNTTYSSFSLFGLEYKININKIKTELAIKNVDLFIKTQISQWLKRHFLTSLLYSGIGQMTGTK